MSRGRAKNRVRGQVWREGGAKDVLGFLDGALHGQRRCTTRKVESSGFGLGISLSLSLTHTHAPTHTLSLSLGVPYPGFCLSRVLAPGVRMILAQRALNITRHPLVVSGFDFRISGFDFWISGIGFTRGKDELGAQGLEHHAALEGHRLRHRQDQIVPAGSGDHGERDARVACGWGEGG